MKMIEYNHFICHFYCHFSVYSHILLLGQDMKFRKKSADLF